MRTRADACDDRVAAIAPPGGDGIVDVVDMLLLLSSWGVCPGVSAQHFGALTTRVCVNCRCPSGPLWKP